MAKCRRCVLGAPAPVAHQPAASYSVGRSATATNLHAPIEQGADRWMVQGELGGGERAVVKWQRASRWSFEDEGTQQAHFERSRLDGNGRVLARAIQLVSQFNASRACPRTIVRVSAPATFQVEADDGRARCCWQTQAGGPTAAAARQGQQLLVEAHLPNWRKWSSNTGWSHPLAAEAAPWAAALSHFSFHASGGACLLCDLKGTETEEGVALLSDPCIHSRGRSYGPSDLGPDGIRTWFARHECTELCRHWLRPPRELDLFHLQAPAATLPLKRETVVEVPQILPPSVLPPPLRTGNRQQPLHAATLANELEGTVLAGLRPVFVVDGRGGDVL